MRERRDCAYALERDGAEGFRRRFPASFRAVCNSAVQIVTLSAQSWRGILLRRAFSPRCTDQAGIAGRDNALAAERKLRPGTATATLKRPSISVIVIAPPPSRAGIAATVEGPRSPRHQLRTREDLEPRTRHHLFELLSTNTLLRATATRLAAAWELWGPGLRYPIRNAVIRSATLACCCARRHRRSPRFNIFAALPEVLFIGVISGRHGGRLAFFPTADAAGGLVTDALRPIPPWFSAAGIADLRVWCAHGGAHCRHWLPLARAW